jgi:hypothetical protein
MNSSTNSAEEMMLKIKQLTEIVDIERSTNALLLAELKEARALIASLKESQQQSSPRAAQRLAEKQQRAWEETVASRAQKVKLGI